MAQGRDPVFDVGGHLGAELEAEQKLVGEQGRERGQQAPEPAPDVRDCDGLCECEGCGGRCVGGVVGGPVHEGGTGGAVVGGGGLAFSKGEGGREGGGMGMVTMSIGGRRRGWRARVAGRISSAAARGVGFAGGFAGRLRAFAACRLLALWFEGERIGWMAV